LSERGSVEGLQTCPKCGQEVDKDHINRELNEFKNELNDLEKILSEMTGEVTALELSYKYLEDERRVHDRRRATLDADIISLDEASRRVKTAEKEALGLKKMLDNAIQPYSPTSAAAYVPLRQLLLFNRIELHHVHGEVDAPNPPDICRALNKP